MIDGFALASFPGLPHFFVIQFTLSIIHRSGKAVKNGRRPGLIHHMSGREVDVGGKGLMFKYVPTKLESGSFNRANV